MNHKPTMLTVTAIVAAMAVTGIAATAIPQQALAWGHHHHNNNGVKVSQSIHQINVCSGQPPELQRLAAVESQSTVCVNDGSNNADIQR
jgi:hypothetical protein